MMVNSTKSCSAKLQSLTAEEKRILLPYISIELILLSNASISVTEKLTRLFPNTKSKSSINLFWKEYEKLRGEQVMLDDRSV
jgi:hypothetical protein